MTTDESTDRQARLAEIRRQIADNCYETPEKLQAAVDRLWDSLQPPDDLPAAAEPAPHFRHKPR